MINATEKLKPMGDWDDGVFVCLYRTEETEKEGANLGGLGKSIPRGGRGKSLWQEQVWRLVEHLFGGR